MLDSIDTSTWLGYFQALITVIQGVLALEPESYTIVLAANRPVLVSVSILFMAGMSGMLGQSVVLFANRVTPRRFIFSLMIGAMSLVLSVFFWAATIWFSASFFLGAKEAYRTTLIIVSMSYAPLFFGVFVLIPYWGNIIYQILRVWICLALIVGVQVAYQTTFEYAVFGCLIGWGLYELVIHIPIFRIKQVRKWWWRLMVGKEAPMSVEEVVEQFTNEHYLPPTGAISKVKVTE